MERLDGSRHVWVSDILSGKFVESADSPGSMVLESGIVVQRVRIYGIAVSSQEIIVDDGTGSILVRSFDRSFKADLSSPILVIGKPRVHDGECYILGEIVKVIDAKWLEFARKLNPQSSKSVHAVAPQNGFDALGVIRELDFGDGADYNTVISKIGKNGEELIVHMLALGEIFEIRPGRLKILE